MSAACNQNATMQCLVRERPLQGIHSRNHTLSKLAQTLMMNWNQTHSSTKSMLCSFKASAFSFSSLKACSLRLLKEKWDVEFIYTLDIQREKKKGGGGRPESLFTFFSETIGESSVNTHRAQTFILFPELSSALPGNSRELEDSLSRIFSAYCAGSFAHNSHYCQQGLRV